MTYNFGKIFNLSKDIATKSQLFIIGTGEEKLINEIQAKVDDYKLKDSITICGFLPIPAQNFISKLDILVMPTIDFEGFGYSMVEAMVFGIPIVASKVGAIPEIIDNEVDGFVIEPQNFNKWIKILNKLILDKKLREKIGKNGKNKIVKNFSAIEMANNFYYHCLF